MKSLRQAREERGIKQLAVANALSITRQTYAKYEENPSSMTVHQAEAACDFIGCDVGEIFFGRKFSETESFAPVGTTD